MLKRVVGLGIGLSMLLSMSAFAAVTSSTTTTYSTDSKISVTTTVSGADAGDKITYLVHKKGATLTDLQDSQIVYIDQVTVGASAPSFTYKTETTNIGSTVLVGGSSITSPQTGVTVPGYVNVKSADGSVLATGDIKTESTDVAGSSLVKVTLSNSLNISSITKINGNSADDALCFVGGPDVLWVNKALLATDTATDIVVSISDSSVRDLLGLNKTTYTEDGENLVAVSAFGQVVGPAAEYGIVFSTGEISDTMVPTEVDDSTDLSSGAVAFPALGKNGAGQFVVQLADNNLKGKTLHARAYTKDGNTYTYSTQDKVVTIAAE